MSEDEDSLGIVEAIVTLASKLKMGVIAEGIETYAQLQSLRVLECQYGGGYLFSKPLTIENVERLLRPGDHSMDESEAFATQVNVHDRLESHQM